MMTVEVDPNLRITIDDARAAGHCPSGVRNWFLEHNLNFREFLKEGIDAKTFLADGDALAEQVVIRKLEREAAIPKEAETNG